MRAQLYFLFFSSDFPSVSDFDPRDRAIRSRLRGCLTMVAVLQLNAFSQQTLYMHHSAFVALSHVTNGSSLEDNEASSFWQQHLRDLNPLEETL